MHSRAYNAQFVTTDFRLLEDMAFYDFMRAASYPLYMMLRRYVWRSFERRHSVERVNELLHEGYLVASVPLGTIAATTGLRRKSNVSRLLKDLDRRGVIRTVRTGRQNAYVLGTWEDRSARRDGRYIVEIFYLDQLFGSGERFPEFPATGNSEFPATGNSEFPATETNNREENRERNREENREEHDEEVDDGVIRFRY